MSTRGTVLLGLDLAWGEGTEDRPANRSGVVAIDSGGKVLDAGWRRGIEETATWVEANGNGERLSLLFVDAPLVVSNATGQRRCEREVGHRYGRYLVSANSTNVATRRKAGVALLRRLGESGWAYDDGTGGPPARGRRVSECYPYTTLVGARELGLPDRRPAYKRRPRAVPAGEFPARRAQAFRSIVERLVSLADAETAIDLRSHPETRAIAENPPPLSSSEYKAAEDLLDAAICAWTASLWHRHGKARCDVLGADDPSGPPRATIIAPRRD